MHDDDLVSLEEEILSAIRRIIRAVDLHSRDLLRRYQLTSPQLACLRFVSRQGLVNTGEIARGISLGQATLTGILDRLERRDLLTRRRSEIDRRCVLVELTELGREMVATVPAPLQERFARRLGQLAESDRQRLSQALADVVSMMEASDLDAAPVLESGAHLELAAAGAPALALVRGGHAEAGGSSDRNA